MKANKLKSQVVKKLILFDAHAIIHRAYHALPEFATAGGEPTGALYGLSTMLLKIIGDLKPDYMVACFDLPGPTFRHEVYDAYKAGRAKIDDNLIIQLERAKDVFTAFGIPIYAHPGFEADDIIGTIVSETKKLKIKEGQLEVIIASGDMDALQLVDGARVQVYTLKKGINDTILYDEKKVLARFSFLPKMLTDYKGLRGDPSDNIIGVRGIGEKTATSLITAFGTVEDIYKVLKKNGPHLVETLAKAGISDRIKNLLLENEENALFSKTLATIRIDAPIHFALPLEWRENLDINKLLTLFAALEFKTMGERVKQLIGKTDVISGIPPSQNQVSPRDEKESCLALWVIDSNIANPTLDDVYSFTKTDKFEEAKKVIESELDQRKVRKVFEEIEKPIMDIVTEMNGRGIKVEKKVLKNLSTKYHAELTRLERVIWQSAGEEFNINSPKILSRILFEKLALAGKRQKKTSTGALSTKESELEKLKDKHPIIVSVLEYRELAKLLSTYIDAIPPLLDKSSRLHSTFLQAGSTTGRMASNNPNLQNIPNKTLLGRAIRHAFVAEEGFKLVALDYSQIELRIAAILSEDAKLIEIFKSGVDVHSGVAMRVFKVSADQVDKGMRTKAKTINFGILYGMGVNALKANLGVDREEAEKFYNEYFKTFTGLAKYLEQIKSLAKEHGYTQTLFGRRRYFVGLKSPLPFVRAQAERMAMNAPIQGTQADLTKMSMKKIDDYIKSEKYEQDIRLVLQVHDELVYEIKDSLVAESVKHLKSLMEKVLPEEKTIGVPIVVDVSIGENWGQMERL